MTTHPITGGGCDAEPVRDPLRTSAVRVQLLADQEGGCAICADELVVAPNAVDNLTGVVDHDESTGAVRGLLCHRCHRGITGFGDDQVKLRRAATYLRAGGARRSFTKGRALRSVVAPDESGAEIPAAGATGMTEAVS